MFRSNGATPSWRYPLTSLVRGYPASSAAANHAPEVGQAMGVVPGRHPRIGRPALEVERVAALEDHPVDRARPAEHLATRVVDATAVHERLRLRLIAPVVEPVPDRKREGCRHVDEGVDPPVGAPCLEDEDRGSGIGAEAVRKDA